MSHSPFTAPPFELRLGPTEWSLARVPGRPARTGVLGLFVTALLSFAAETPAAPFDVTSLVIDPKRTSAIRETAITDEGTRAFGFFNTQQEWEMDHLLSPRWLRPLTDRGIDYVAVYSAELLGNVRGGLKRGPVFSGVLEAGVNLETEKLSGWPGATFYASSLVSHGPSLSDRYLGDLYGGSSLEAESSLRLYEAWLDQSFFDEILSMRAGQLAADREFMGTDVGMLFMNASFGWPAAFGLGVDAPAYPVAAPGVRLRIDGARFWLQSAIFTGRPEPLDDEGEPIQKHGLYFHFQGGALALWEAGYSTATEDHHSRHPGVYKLGGWLHTGKFEDQYYDDLGLSLADPFSSQNPRSLRHNWGLYAVAEQNIWCPAMALEEMGLSLFARVGGVPSDRNPVAFSCDGGLHYVGLWPGRPHDVTGLAASYNQISRRLRAWTRDDNLFAIPPAPLPDYEAVLELTHRIEIKPWWYVQPDLQFILHPGGSRALANALVIGLRSTLSF